MVFIIVGHSHTGNPQQYICEGLTLTLKSFSSVVVKFLCCQCLVKHVMAVTRLLHSVNKDTT